MEHRTNNEFGQLQGMEAVLYQKFIEKYPKITEQDFIELRKEALKVSNPAVKKFFNVAGLAVENSSDAQETKKEMLN